MKSGIYAIVNTLNDKRYIGSSVDMPKRWHIHRYYLERDGAHANRHLRAAWKKYGAQAFEFVVLEYVHDVTQLHVREQWHLELYQPNVYNVGLVAASPSLGVKRDNGRRGMKHSEETKRLIAQSHTGRKRQFTPEWRANMSAARIGKTHLSPESRARIAALNTGQKRSEQTRTKLRAAWNGRVISDETRAKSRRSVAIARDFLLKQTHCRNGHSYEDAYLQKGSRRCRTCQREATQRWRDKQPKPVKRIQSAETRSKMAASRKAWWERKRQQVA